MIVDSKVLQLKAKAGGYAVGAFNVSTEEAVKGVLAAATELKAPVIIETSEKEKDYLVAKVFADMVRDLAGELDVPVAIHLDHGQSLESVKAAIAAGYTSVHIDASALDYDENLKLTKSVVDYAHANGIPVEGELGHVGGSSQLHGESADLDAVTYTDPEKAAEFVAETAIDTLASSIGNIHGIYKNEPKLDLDRLGKIAQIGIPLSLHGGSGIPAEQVKAAISLGITKVNVNTELRAAYTESLREELAENPDEIVPYNYLPQEAEAVKEIVKEKIQMFGSAGKA